MMPPAVPPPVEALQHSLDELIAESQTLRGDVHKAEELRAVKIAQIRRENRINLVLLGVLAVFMFGLLAIAYQNIQISRDTKRNADAITDCTTQGGTCYEEGRLRTAEALVTLQRVQIYIVQCSRELPNQSGPQFDARYERCIADRLAAARAVPGVQPPSPPPARPSPARSLP